MIIAVLGRLLTASILGVGACYFAARYWQYRTQAAGPTFLGLTAVGILCLPAQFCAIREGLGFTNGRWANLIGYILFTSAVLLGYFVNIRFLTNRTYRLREILSDPVCATSAPLIVIMSFVLLLRPATTSFTDGTLEFSGLFALGYMGYYLVFVIVDIGIIMYFWNDIQRHRGSTSYVLRRLCYCVGSFFAFVGPLLSIIDYGVAWGLQDASRPLITWFVHDVCRGMGFLFLSLCLVMPDRIFRRGVEPFERMIEGQHRQLLQQLDGVLHRVAGLPPRRTVSVDSWRLLISISEASEYVLSHTPAQSPQDQAHFLDHALRHSTHVAGIGPYRHEVLPTLSVSQLMTHYLAVAWHLDRMQQRGAARIVVAPLRLLAVRL